MFANSLKLALPPPSFFYFCIFTHEYKRADANLNRDACLSPPPLKLLFYPAR